MLTLHFVMTHGRLPIITHVFIGHVFGTTGVFIANSKNIGRNRRCHDTVIFLIELAIQLNIFRPLCPRPHGKGHKATTHTGCMGHCVGRHGNNVGSVFKAFKGLGANIAARLFKELAIVGLHRTGLEGVENHPSRLIKALSGGIHIYAKTIVFNASQTTTHADERTTVRHIIEHRHIGGHTQGVFVPGQNNRRSTDLNGTGLPRHKA